jgi:hypothetical protein
MPLQNRVTPTGEIVAVATRGLFMGNRGILHDDVKRLGRSRWKHKVWIICRTCFRGRHRKVMSPRRYTELFFFDEAVAIAAGHRPCFECRRQEFYAWQRAWQGGNGVADTPRAPEMDRVLHAERVVTGTRRQKTWRSPLDELPDAAFVLWEGLPHIRIGGMLRPWSYDGYGAAVVAPETEPVTVLTPPSSIGAIRGGYRAILHFSALL